MTKLPRTRHEVESQYNREDVQHIQSRSKNTIEYEASKEDTWETKYFAGETKAATSENTEVQGAQQAMSKEGPASARLHQPATRAER